MLLVVEKEIKHVNTSSNSFNSYTQNIIKVNSKKLSSTKAWQLINVIVKFLELTVKLINFNWLIL